VLKNIAEQIIAAPRIVEWPPGLEFQAFALSEEESFSAVQSVGIAAVKTGNADIVLRCIFEHPAAYEASVISEYLRSIIGRFQEKGKAILKLAAEFVPAVVAAIAVEQPSLLAFSLFCCQVADFVEPVAVKKALQAINAIAGAAAPDALPEILASAPDAEGMPRSILAIAEQYVNLRSTKVSNQLRVLDVLFAWSSVMKKELYRQRLGVAVAISNTYVVETDVIARFWGRLFSRAQSAHEFFEGLLSSGVDRSFIRFVLDRCEFKDELITGMQRFVGAHLATYIAQDRIPGLSALFQFGVQDPRWTPHSVMTLHSPCSSRRRSSRRSRRGSSTRG
jgi:hypothetical protein